MNKELLVQIPLFKTLPNVKRGEWKILGNVHRILGDRR